MSTPANTGQTVTLRACMGTSIYVCGEPAQLTPARKLSWDLSQRQRSHAFVSETAA